MAMMTSFQILLHFYSNGQQEEFAVGTGIANRNRIELENIFGFFVNTLPIKVDLTGNPNFQELLERVKQTTLEMFSNSEVGFDRIVELIQP